MTVIRADTAQAWRLSLGEAKANCNRHQETNREYARLYTFLPCRPKFPSLEKYPSFFLLLRPQFTCNSNKTKTQLEHMNSRKVIWKGYSRLRNTCILKSQLHPIPIPSTGTSHSKSSQNLKPIHPRIPKTRQIWTKTTAENQRPPKP